MSARATERPIIFSAPMVRALLAGQKTQTRRVLKKQPPRELPFLGLYAPHLTAVWGLEGATLEDPDFATPLPYATGDTLWLRESWQCGMSNDGPQISYRATPDYFPIDAWNGPNEGAGPSFNYDLCPGANFSHWLGDVIEKDGPWRSPLHMPRWAARIALKVTQVRVQRLNHISQYDANAEGVASLTAFQDIVSRALW